MRVLIVEDEPVIALEIEAIVRDRIPGADIVVAHSVRSGTAAIASDLEMAFLDIDVADGKTYPLALELRSKLVPFVFVSGADRAGAPVELADIPMIRKPFSPEDIERQVDAFIRMSAEGA